MKSVSPRECWCGYPTLFAYSADYDVCKSCGTLVSRAHTQAEDLTVNSDEGELYSKDYWLKRQTNRYGFPSIQERARLDLPERCTFWLQHLLPICPPPAQILELGCAHGGYVALLQWAGYTAMGTEMSPWVVNFAQSIFHIPVFLGPLEAQLFEPESFDVVVLNDVLEHLPTPLETLASCRRLLKKDGVFIIQTPEYKEHLSYDELLKTKDFFLKHMDHKSDEHLYLYSRRSAQLLFERLGYNHLDFASPIFSHDMFFTASRRTLTRISAEEITAKLNLQPTGRLVQALLDKAAESADRGWAIKRLEDDRKDST